MERKDLSEPKYISVIGYDNGMPYVVVRCSCTNFPKLTEDHIIACSYCGCDLEYLYYEGIRRLK